MVALVIISVCSIILTIMALSIETKLKELLQQNKRIIQLLEEKKS